MTKLTYTDGTNTTEFDMNDPTQAAAFNEFMGEVQDGYAAQIATIEKQLGISHACAIDVWYLRSRSRHTPALEAELIRLHAAGTPPNINDFGHHTTKH